MADEVFTTGNANVQAFNAATQHAKSRGDAAEAERAATEAARLALPAQATALTAPGILAATQSADAARAAAVTLPKFRSTTTSNPAAPTQAELDANPNGIGGLKLTAAGGTQQLKWTPHTTAGAWADVGQPSATAAEVTAATTRIQAAEASLKRISVDATLYGVAEGASAQTLMDALAATPDGGTLVCPRVKLIHHGGRLILHDRRNLTVLGNGLRVEALSTLADPSNAANGGVYLIGCTDMDLHDLTYDGRLDTRTPYGSDFANTNLKSGWNILTGCKNVRLHNVHGNRCMMDGIYIGHADDTVATPTPIQANMPTNTVLNHCGGDGNYRQGLSVVGCNGLTGSGNRFHNTGKTGGGKFTLPAAGVDLEAYEQAGFYNLGVDLTDTEVNGNRGHGVLIENGTQGAQLRGVRGKGNGGGVGFSVRSKDSRVSGVTLTESGTDPVEPINIVLRGTNNHVEGANVTCQNGSQAAAIASDGAFCGLRDLMVFALPGTQRTGTVSSEGAEAQLNNITVVDGREPDADRGIIDVRGSGSRSNGLRTVGYNGDTTSRPIKQTAGRLGLHSVSGYSVQADVDVPGGKLAPATGLTFAYSSGRAATVQNVTATLEAATAERLIYRVSGLIVTGGAGAQPSVILTVAGGGVYDGRVLSASAIDANDASLYLTALLSNRFLAAVAVPANQERGIQVTLLVELARA